MQEEPSFVIPNGQQDTAFLQQEQMVWRKNTIVLCIFVVKK